MAVPIVSLRKVKRKEKDKYQIDYTVGGKRIRKIVGANKREAEQIRAKIQQELTLGTHDISAQQKPTIDLGSLITEFLRYKKNTVQSDHIASSSRDFSMLRLCFRQ